jgi:2-polyprenyl-6-methoxyphenol hydroxylase-like FAD-dependent oxidoreductase
MTMRGDAEIAIVGAGPTGLTLACQLLRRGVACRVFDQATEASERSRAIGVSARSLEVLDEFGAAADLVKLGVPCGVANFYSSGKWIGRVSASAARDTRYPFMLAVPQNVTESVLEQHLTRLGGAVERGMRLRGLSQQTDGVSLVLDGPDGEHTVRAQWVVGADGAHSTVRELAGIDVVSRATNEVYVNVDARVSDGPAAGEGHYYFSPGALTVIVPLAEIGRAHV